jgi:D-beta-D-heptose 7-phosphate kinase/D-beta-D-heptose 1-phosphate adenosyltransferase
LLIGDACEDTYTYGTVDRLSPEAPVPVFVPEYQIVKDGMASNVCRNLEALGCEVNYLFGKISKKDRLIDKRSKQHLLRIDNDTISDPVRFETAIPPIYHAVVISDYGKGTVDYDLVTELIKTVNVPIFVDTKKTDLAKFNGCFVKINDLEKSRATSLPDAEWLIVTHGANGASWNGWKFGNLPVDVADVTGAGDTFLAALVYKIIEKSDMREAINFANKSASITVQHVGVYAPRLEEIL